eukprot:TRINITY_DN70636_c0_g1_i1.p1 TRINITY_DN70636_c0_g1~~TRINITY_DN70636_c0_g1_i1.p1  ORF type:complete len:622 (+),score=184.83 TRINITY_DN70636_c0_g1_i1:62-1867(+)
MASAEGERDDTGQRWRAAQWDPASEPEPPLAKWGEGSRPHIPDMTRFRRLGVRGRAEAMCSDWIVHGYGAQAAVAWFYVFKTAAFAAVWWWLTCPMPGEGGDGALRDWAGDAFRRAVLLTVFWEVFGLGGSCGPLNGRYLPSPVVAPLYFLRPGAIKLPPAWLRRRLPMLTGGNQRTWLDVALYAGLLAALVDALRSSCGGISPERCGVIVALLVANSVRDATLFCASRSDHWLWTLLFLCSTDHWLTGCKLVQAAIWFYAGVSKVGPWFPYVVMAMISNSSAVRAKWLRRRTVRSLEKADLRPSPAVLLLAHFGTFTEMVFPIVLLLTPGPILSAAGVTFPVSFGHVALLHCVVFHLFIISHIPMGAPLEWNVACVISAVLLFGLNGGVSTADLLALPPHLAILAALLCVVPLYGNLFPKGISFLIGMRYYAGNWPNTEWIWKKSAEHKWQRLLQGRAVCKMMHDQVGTFFKSDVVMAAEWRQYAFRAMNLHGHLLPGFLRRVLRGGDMDDWRYSDGEVVAGVVLGWNFGDGYLHDKELLRVVQEYCGFEEGELYHMRIESCPTLIGRAYEWEIRDAAHPDAVWAEGSEKLEQLERMQPY